MRQAALLMCVCVIGLLLLSSPARGYGSDAAASEVRAGPASAPSPWITITTA